MNVRSVVRVLATWGDRREQIEQWHGEMHRSEGTEGEQRPAGA